MLPKYLSLGIESLCAKKTNIFGVKSLEVWIKISRAHLLKMVSSASLSSLYYAKLSSVNTFLDEFFINQILNIWGKYPNYASPSASPYCMELISFNTAYRNIRAIGEYNNR